MKEEILSSWEARAKEEVRAASVQPKLELLNSIPKFLDRLVRTLLAAGSKDQAEENSKVAEEHGAHRASQPDYSLDEVIFEYHLLRESIVEAIKSKREPSDDALRIIHEFLDRGIRKAVVEYVEHGKQTSDSSRHRSDSTKSQLAEAIDVAKIGFYDWDIENDNIKFSEQMQRDWGIGADSSLSDVLKSIHEGDRERVSKLIEDTIRNRTPYSTIYRVNKADGDTIWIEAKGRVSYDERGKPKRFMGTSQDVSVQTAARDLVEVERKKFEAILAASPGGSAIMRGEDLRYETVNDEFQSMFPGKELVGRKLFDAFPEAVKQGFPEILKNVLETGKTFFGREVPFTSAQYSKGDEVETKFLDLSYVRIDGPDGRPYGIYHNAIDVSERVASRKRLELSNIAIESSRADLEDTLESMSDAFFSVDREWKITQVNSAMLRLSRLSADELIGRNFLSTFYSDSKLKASTSYREYIDAMRERRSVSFVDYYEPFKGWFAVRCSPKADGGMAVFFNDISANRIAEQKLAIEQNKLELIIREAPIGIAVLSGQPLRFDSVNETWRQLTSAREFIGKTYLEVYPEPSLKPIAAIIDKVYATGDTFSVQESTLEVEVLPGVFEERSYDFSYIRITDIAGKPYGVFGIASNVSDRVLAKDLMSEAKQEAERANHLKSAFLANMSHEIRTPLGAILGFNDLLRDPSITAGERANYLNIVARNGAQLSVIIDDILDLSKVEAGHLALEYSQAEHKKIGADVVSLMHVKAREKDLNLEYFSDAETPETITSDPTRIRQILLNLVGNAIKFTQFGSVTINSYGSSAADGRRELCFEITDTGIGLTPAQQSRLFQAFTQADETTTRRFGGTGLGLALSRRLARALGGDITILRSKENSGTTFLLRIPDYPERKTDLEVPTPNSSRHEPELGVKALEGLNILVVDDAPDNQQLIWRYLTKAGATVASAENGQTGYKAALANDFDLVLMDIQMPVMDGYTATSKLREAGYAKPIIALTAHAMSDIRKKALNVGYTDYLTKPIDPKSLVNSIFRLTRH